MTVARAGQGTRTTLDLFPGAATLEHFATLSALSCAWVATRLAHGRTWDRAVLTVGNGNHAEDDDLAL